MILKLEDEGRLSLSDRVTKYFPGYTRAGEMTLSHLVHMRSGIIDANNDYLTFFDIEGPAAKDDFWARDMNDEAFFEKLYSHDLRYPPGSRCSYCNTNYKLLAVIIEKLTGMSYKDALRKNFFEPLGMERSSSMALGDLTSCPENGYMELPNASQGCGDIHSNALDLLRFDRALFGGQLIGPGQLEKMTGLIDGYGCGWHDYYRMPGFVTIPGIAGHSGSTKSYHTENLRFDRTGTYLITMDPCSDSRSYEVFDRLLELCLKELG